MPNFHAPALLTLWLTISLPAVAQVAAPPDEPATAPQAEEKDASTEKPDDADTEPAESASEADEEPEIDPELIRLRLADGSLIAGHLTVSEISLSTEFGELLIPVTEIRTFTPGLNSHTQLQERLNELLDDLGGDDYTRRENAQKELTKLGPPVRRQLEDHRESDNAELARRVKVILTELEKMAEDLEADPNSPAMRPWLDEDTVQTTYFTALGTISPQTFTVESSYGSLTVPIADISYAERPAAIQHRDERRVVTVDGTNLAQLKFKSSGIRVERGARITIKADGKISRAGSTSYTSTPDGNARLGTYQQNPQIHGGALVARIGSGDVIKVGSNQKLTAPQSGVLRFAIGMRPDYVGRYQFIGEYKVRVTVSAPKK